MPTTAAYNWFNMIHGRQANGMVQQEQKGIVKHGRRARTKGDLVHQNPGR